MKNDNKDVSYTPELNNDELNQIKEDQAKFVYENAINMLKEIDESIKRIVEKAHTLFKYLFTAMSGLYGLYSYETPKYDTISIVFISIMGTLFLIIIVIYLSHFIKTQPHISLYNPPKKMLNKIILEDMKHVYINTSILIQKYAIPQNQSTLEGKAKRLRCMTVLIVFITLFTFIHLLYCLLTAHPS